MKRKPKPQPKDVMKAIRVLTDYFGHSPFDIKWIITMEAASKFSEKEQKILK